MTNDNDTAQGLALGAMITALTAGGFEVAFTADSDGFWAHVDDRTDPQSDKGCTAGGKTISEALVAALPEGFEICECDHMRDSHWEHAEPGGHRAGCAVLGCTCTAYAAGLPAPTLEDDVRTLSADMTDAMERLDALESESTISARDIRVLIWVLGEVLADQNPDGELAQKMRERNAERQAAAAANQP